MLYEQHRFKPGAGLVGCSSENTGAFARCINVAQILVALLQLPIGISPCYGEHIGIDGASSTVSIGLLSRSS